MLLRCLGALPSLGRLPAGLSRQVAAVAPHHAGQPQSRIRCCVNVSPRAPVG